MRKCLLAIAAILMAGGQWASALESPYVGSDVSGDDFAGENKGVIPVKINPAGLSLDSIYFLAFRIDSFDADYPNTYTLEKTSYSTYHNFLLHYRYKNSEGKWWSDDESLVRVSLAGVVSSLGNEDVTGQIELASSGSLTKFAYTTSTSITLPKGRSKLKFYMDKASYNLLEMKFTYKQP